MAASRQRLVFRIEYRGFPEWKTVEFLEEIETTQFCQWCGLVTVDLYLLSCLHVICYHCHDEAQKAPNAVCLLDQEHLSPDRSHTFSNNVSEKPVRCANRALGCEHVGRLQDLNDHLRETCAFEMTTCFKCNGRVANKDMRDHFFACEDPMGIFLRGSDVQVLLGEMENARQQLEQALDLRHLPAEDPLRVAVDSASDILARVATQLSAANPNEDCVDAVE